MLSDSESSDGEGLHKLTINEHYAKAFEYKKEREELQKLKEKYGSDFEDDEGENESGSESNESEDEDGEELTPAVDAAIFRTLARIKRKDPEIYNSQKNIFGEEQEKIKPVAKAPRVSKDKSKALTIKQAALDSVLNPTSRSPSPEPLTHNQEQAALRNETIAAFHQNAADDEEDDLLVPREKTKDELELEEEEYKTFLEREVGDINAILADDETKSSSEPEDDADSKEKKEDKKKKKKAANSPAKEKKKKSKQEVDQEFLMSYILNRGWIDRSAKRVPTYQEVTSSKSKSKAKGKQKADDESPFASPEPESGDEAAETGLPTEDPEIDEDDFEEIVDRFESSYNFRFEEPDAAVIKSYPREMDSTVRRGDTTRKEARERKKQRKEEKLLQKKEEIKRLKSLKMKELRSKLEKIGNEGGKDFERDEALQALDLEGDWDPEAHDREMAALYGAEDGGEEFDEKPQWDDDIDIGDIEGFTEAAPETKKKSKKKKKKDNEEDGVDVDAMDADVKHFSDEEWDGTEEMRKRKIAEYMDEIDALDFNDMVGDLPTRFKYVPVQAETYGLTPVEILMATDKELNEFMGIKKFAPYRSGGRWDNNRNDRLKELKHKLHERIGANGGEAAVPEPPKKKRKGKKERMRLKAAGEDEVMEDEEAGGDDLGQGLQSKKRKLEDEGVDNQSVVVAETENNSGNKKKRKRKHRGEGNGIEA